MAHDLQNVRRLAGRLRATLVQCGQDPDVDPVHDTRTGTRRLQATLEELIRELPDGDAGKPVRSAATALTRLLKKIRRAAGPVRDLDVHRKLLSKLMKRSLDPAHANDGAGAEAPQPEIQAVLDREVLETPEAGLRVTGTEQQSDDLDAWLKHRRGQLASELQAQAADLTARLDKRLADLQSALQAKRGRGLRKKPPAVVALDAFARLATEMQVLDAANLHDFRKGAKKARYVAELATQGDKEAAQVGETLKKLQDEIGDWHDWLVLAEEAHAALGDQGSELIALVETERERHFVTAMRTATRLRGRLMGEWLATARRPQRAAAKSPVPKARSATQ